MRVGSHWSQKFVRGISTNQSINQSINRSIDRLIDRSINQSTNQPTNQATNQSINLLKAKRPNGHLYRSKIHDMQ